MTQTVTILGINGRFGQEVAKAFVAENWRVIGMGRSNRVQLEGVEFFEGDVSYPEQTRKAIADADVVVNALNMPYDKWDKGRAENQLAKVLEALKGSGKTLMFPGNMYNYRAQDHIITPQMRQIPEKDKGQIRKRMEGQLAKASNDDGLQVLIIRLADFYAPNATESNFDLAILARIKSGILQYPGDLSIGHSWAYLPDAGRVFVKVAERRAHLPQFENFHYAGHFATGHQLIGIIQKCLAKPARVKPVPLGLLGVIGWFVPIIREVVKMSYLWNEPHRLEDPKLDEILGENFPTPFAEAVSVTVRSYLPKKLQSRS